MSPGSRSNELITANNICVCSRRSPEWRRNSGDWPKSMQLAQRILHEDQFREDIHCLILRAHAAMGNRGAVKEHFEGLKRLLQDGVGRRTEWETRKLYEELSGR